MDKYRLSKELGYLLLCTLLLCFIVSNDRFIFERYSTVTGGGKSTFAHLAPAPYNASLVQAKHGVVLSTLPLFISSKATHRDGAWRESSVTTFDDVDINVIDNAIDRVIDPESSDEMSVKMANLARNNIRSSSEPIS